MKSKYLFITIILFRVILLIYLKFTTWPEMILWPYLMTRGWLPYRDIAIAHTPLMLALLAIFYKIAGVGILQLKIFTWAVVLGLDILVYMVVKSLWNNKVALITLAAFAFWQLFFDGNGLWFDLFMGVFAFASYYFVQKKNYFWSGVTLALAFISKQTAVWFLIPIGLEIFNVRQPLKEAPLKDAWSLVKGGLVILVLLVIPLLLLGILPSFYHWAINFGLFILPKAQGQVQLPDFKNLAVSVFPFLIFIPLFFNRKKILAKSEFGKSKFFNLLLWTIAGSLGAYPRFEYFHFQPALPFLAIATGLVLTGAAKKDRIMSIFISFYMFASVYLFANYFLRNFNEGTRFYETDVQDVVAYVKDNTSSNDKIFVMNWWDSIYSLSDRLPGVDPWVPQLSWYTELPGIQEKMVSDLAQSKPKVIILNQYSEIGLSAYIPKKVYNYVMQNYKLKEKVDGINILVPNR